MDCLGERWYNAIKNDYKKYQYGKDNKKIKDILFQVILHCPGENGPILSKKFKDYDIKFPWDYKKLKEQILLQLKLIDKDTYCYCEKTNEFEYRCKELISKYKSLNYSFIYFKKDGNSQLNTLYTKLRNVFAHGNFFMKNNKYMMWNLTTKNDIAFVAYLSHDELLKLYLCLKFKSNK